MTNKDYGRSALHAGRPSCFVRLDGDRASSLSALPHPGMLTPATSNKRQTMARALLQLEVMRQQIDDEIATLRRVQSRRIS